MSDDRIRVDPDFLRQHAHKVAALSSDVAEAASAAGQVSLGGQAFGIICLRLCVSDLGDFDGAAADAYRALLMSLTSSLQRCAELCSGLGVAAELLAGIIKAVHDVVRDVIADLVGFVVQELALVAGTLGAATPVVAAQLAVKSAKWTALLSGFIRDLVTSAGSYGNLAKTIKEFVDRASSALNESVPAT
ncbi:type VII secretion target [uncultured Microbacterium sp.]|uniref:type VII secretion target n=1 Tax=uncultured Microbacterium sp. TaxID=191216 RepID=UPI0025EF261E|nr:type VII secretion target [uncultured Microbacterium sp.]